MSIVLYAFVIFLSACLLSLIQPLIGKVPLPWLRGGVPVWSVSVLFFQVLLLVGHVYSHWVTEWLSRHGQMWVHLSLVDALLLALIVTSLVWQVPLIPGSACQPRG